jgi:hypothetical protein
MLRAAFTAALARLAQEITGGMKGSPEGFPDDKHRMSRQNINGDIPAKLGETVRSYE